MSAPLFKQFRDNIAVQNAADISTSYAGITKRLNLDFWDIESDFTHRRQVGSYGRNTAVHGISDLDMVFELPWATYEKYKAYTNNGPSQLLQAVRNSLLTRYPNTTIKGDGQVVCIEFSKFRVEVLPAFWDADADGYRFGDTNNGGTWKICKPIQEIDAVNQRNKETNRNLKHVCKMIRAWKNFNGVNISGMLIDTLIYNFFGQTDKYDAVSYGSYDQLFVSLFSYVGNLEHQDFWLAPGSGQRINNKGKFQSKAKKAAVKCQEALDADTEKKKTKIWRDVFGRSFPSGVVKLEKAAAVYESVNDNRYTTEQFIEDQFPVDIQFDIEINSEVTTNGQHTGHLRALSKVFVWLPVGRGLRFFVESCDVPAPYTLLWKVRNVGAEAERRKMIRGDIVLDEGKNQRIEKTTFHGEHFVEAYVIKDGVCVARDLIDVPISENV
jgi:hypothetical protein